MRTWGRREFLHGLTAAGTASLLGVHPAPVAAEPPPETTRLRLTFQSRTICTGLKYFRELLETEGFTDLQYANEESTSRRAARLASGASDIDVTYAAYLILRVDAGDPIVVLTGAHCGLPRAVCDQWDTHDPRPEGKGGRHRRVWGTRHVYIASMAACVGLDPRKDIKWVTYSGPEAIQLLAEGNIDARMGCTSRVAGTSSEEDRKSVV